MNKFVLGIDPGIKETGFSLWQLNISVNKQINWKLIWVANFCFKKFTITNFEFYIWEQINKYVDSIENIDFYIERGFNNHRNARSAEKMESLRGNIYGLFNAFYDPKKNGIFPREWQKNYLKNLDNFNYKKDPKKWTKEKSLYIANWLIKENNWDIDIKDSHNISDSILMTWYKLMNIEIIKIECECGEEFIKIQEIEEHRNLKHGKSSKN